MILTDLKSLEDSSFYCFFTVINYISTSSGKPLKDAMDRVLKSHLAGIVRNPALFYGEHKSETARSLNLERYEVSPVEPLHDLKGHIKNMYEIIPSYLSGKDLDNFIEEVDVALGKDIKN